MSNFKFEIGDDVIYQNIYSGKIIYRNNYGHNNNQYRVEFPENTTIFIGSEETDKRSIPLHEKDIQLDIKKLRKKKIDSLLI